jgi:polyhydroxyalkanoate synthesis regulator phasin
MLEEIKTNIEKLISLYETEKQRADALQAELDKSKAEAAASKERIADLDGQIDNLKLQYAFSGAGDPALAKERINKLIHEIDRCIKLLEK